MTNISRSYSQFRNQTLDWNNRIELPSDYLSLIPTFFRMGEREKIERYSEKIAEELKKTNKGIDLKLLWVQRSGLVHISLLNQTSLDLDERGGFIENRLVGDIAEGTRAIAREYVNQIRKIVKTA